MNPRGLYPFMGLLLMSLLLCSCATEKPIHLQLPPTVSMNADAGRGGLLMVEVHLANGEKLPFVIDTGAAMTVFDKSLEPKLGKPVDTGTLVNFGVKQEVNAYAAPQLYLGNVLLRKAGTNVVTFDRKKLADQDQSAYKGFIGMDVLQNYCIQLDFAAGKVHFLDDEHADKTNWGTAFPLTDIGDGCFYINDNLTGMKGPASLVDTGCNQSGWLWPSLYRQWTNQESAADEKIYSPDGTLGGEIYHDIDLRQLDAKAAASDDGHVKFNGVGLRALAQNLVTFDFPKRTMYLKHVSNWPLLTKDYEVTVESAAKSSAKTLVHLLYRNQLPGMPKGDQGTTTDFHFDQDSSPYLDTGTLDVLKTGDSSSIYHYTFTRTSKHGAWKLQKAWRTDHHGHTIEEYPVR